MKSEEIKNQKENVSPQPPPKISYKENWRYDLDSDIAGSSKDNQQIEPKPKTQLSSTGRPVCGEKEEIEERTTFDRDTFNQEKHDEVIDPTSTGRPISGQKSTKRCMLTPRHVEIDLRVPGLSHAVVKEAEHLRVQELVKKIENHLHREALHADLQQKNVYNPFSRNSKEMIRELGNVELFDLCETIPKVQMFSLSSLLESRNCVLHLRTMLDLQRIQKKV